MDPIKHTQQRKSNTLVYLNILIVKKIFYISVLNQDLTAVVPKEQCYCHVIIMALSVYPVVVRAEVDVSILRTRSSIYCYGWLEIIMKPFKMILKWLQCLFLLLSRWCILTLCWWGDVVRWLQYLTYRMGILLTSSASLILSHIILHYITFNRTITNELFEMYCLVYPFHKTCEELKLLCNWRCQCLDNTVFTVYGCCFHHPFQKLNDDTYS